MQKFKFIILLLFTSSLSAQHPLDTLNILKEIVISPYHINDTLLNVPASISVLSSEELQSNNLSDISLVLNKVAGVNMQSGSLNTNRITIRGIGARTPYGTNKIRAFYGSIPLTSGNSETTIEDIDLEILSQAEIIKGPLSSIYGAGLGGAILFSPKISSYYGNSAVISSTVGSFGMIKNTLTYGYASQKGNINISYHNLSSKGYRENSSYNREGVTLAGELFKAEKTSFTYFGNYTYLKAYIPSSIDKNTFETNPQAAANTWKAAKGYEQYRSYLGGLAFDAKIKNGLTSSTSVFINVKDNYEPRPFDILSQNTTGFGGRTQFNSSFKTGKLSTKIIAGAELFKDGFTGNTFANLYEQNNGNGSLQGEKLSAINQDRFFINAFMQIHIAFTRKLEMHGGINYNKTNFELKNTLQNENEFTQKYNYSAIWSPQIAMLYKPSSIQTLYVSASKGFSLPAIEETLTPEGTINDNIKPESGYNIEIGSKTNLINKKMYLELSVYRMIIKDLLVAQRVDDDRYVGKNAGKTLHEGLEVKLNYITRFGNITLQPYINASIGNYKFKDFNDNGNNYTGNDLTGVPNKNVNAGIDLKTGFGLSFTANYSYTDKMPLNDANTEYNDSFQLINIKASQQINPMKNLYLIFSAGINNLTNTSYASMVLVNATGFGNSAPRFYYPGLPINYYGNLRLNYHF